MQKIKRIIPIEEVRAAKWYSDMADLAEIFHHEVVEDRHGTWRWKENRLISHLLEGASRGGLDLNQLYMDLMKGIYTVEERMKVHMQMGYSLSGFGEVFGQHEADEYDLPDLLEKPADYNSDDYFETVIDYMRRVHAGKVLKL